MRGALRAAGWLRGGTPLALRKQLAEAARLTEPDIRLLGVR
jgi:hypothetical protein